MEFQQRREYITNKFEQLKDNAHSLSFRNFDPSAVGRMIKLKPEIKYPFISQLIVTFNEHLVNIIFHILHGAKNTLFIKLLIVLLV